jgi:hypothetical protein
MAHSSDVHRLVLEDSGISLEPFSDGSNGVDNKKANATTSPR